MKFYITNPNESDKESIMRIYKKNRDTLGIPFNRIFDEMIEDKNFIIAVSEDGQLAGFCGFKYKPRKHYYEIEHLCVDDKFRRNKLAIKLLQFHLRFNYTINTKGLFEVRPDVVAYAVEGKPNNVFYDRVSTKYEVVPKQTKVLRKYYLDVEKILNYE